jgi:hypothetical protein
LAVKAGNNPENSENWIARQESHMVEFKSYGLATFFGNGFDSEYTGHVNRLYFNNVE